MGATAYSVRYEVPVATGNQTSMRFAFPWPETRGATVDDSFPGNSTTKKTYRGPQGSVLDGVPLGQLDIEGFNKNNALSLTVLAAVTFTLDLPPDTNPIGHRSTLDSAPMLPNVVAIGCGRGE